ncbi:MAG TPA: hypothetical protein VF610_04830 [Segetibacter sp.]
MVARDTLYARTAFAIASITIYPAMFAVSFANAERAQAINTSFAFFLKIILIYYFAHNNCCGLKAVIIV